VHTDDTDLQVIAWTTKQNFFLCGRSLLWRHFLLLSLESVRRRKRPRKNKTIPSRWTGKTMQAELPPSIYHLPKKTSHELCKKEKNSGKPSLYGTLTAVISGGFRQDISQYGGFPAGGRCYYYKRGYLRTSGIPHSQLPKQRQAHLPCKKTR
jgi:hypothetical protein